MAGRRQVVIRCPDCDHHMATMWRDKSDLVWIKTLIPTSSWRPDGSATLVMFDVFEEENRQEDSWRFRRIVPLRCGRAGCHRNRALNGIAVTPERLIRVMTEASGHPTGRAWNWTPTPGDSVELSQEEADRLSDEDVLDSIVRATRVTLPEP